MVMPLSIVNKGIILEIKVWIKLKGFIPNLGSTIKIIPKIINVREIGTIYFIDSCFFFVFIKFNNKKQTVKVMVRNKIISWHWYLIQLK